MKDGVVDRQNPTRACNEEVYSTLVGDVAYVPRSAKLERRVVDGFGQYLCHCHQHVLIQLNHLEVAHDLTAAVLVGADRTGNDLRHHHSKLVRHKFEFLLGLRLCDCLGWHVLPHLIQLVFKQWHLVK